MPAPKRKREGPARNLELNPRPRFFERQLSGEETLTYETAEKLFALAEEAYVQRPWERLADTELVLVKQPGSGEMCYCSVMGALGQAYAINAYLGPESYRLFKRISGGEPVTTGEFFASQNSVSVEFLPSGKLTPPDKALPGRSAIHSQEGWPRLSSAQFGVAIIRGMSRSLKRECWLCA